MPVSLSPDAKFKIVLASDQSKPDPRPTFLFRYLTGRQWMEVADLADSAPDSKTGREALSKVYDAVRVGLVGWENMIGPDGGPIPYDPASLEDITNPEEVKELLVAVMEHVRPTEGEAGNFPSPAPSAQANSANPALPPGV